MLIGREMRPLSDLRTPQSRRLLQLTADYALRVKKTHIRAYEAARKKLGNRQWRQEQYDDRKAYRAPLEVDDKIFRPNYTNNGKDCLW